MPTYQFLIDDDRYEVPTLVLGEASTDGLALARAKEVLLRSPHHHRVEIYAGDRYLESVRRSHQSPRPRNGDGSRVA